MSAVEYERVLAGNVRAARARAWITQSEMAARMRQLGFPWHAQTAGQIEHEPPQRRITACELTALSLALGTTVEALALPGPDVTSVLFGGHEVGANRLSVVDDSVIWGEAR